MAKKKISKQAKRRLTIITPLLFLALGYLFFTIITTGIQLYQLHHEEQKYKTELKELKKTSSELKTEITKLQDKDYVARYARENYLYTKDGEYVIKVDTDEKQKQKNKMTIDDSYVIYGCFALGILFILYIFIKHSKKKKKKKKTKKNKK